MSRARGLVALAACIALSGGCCLSRRGGEPEYDRPLPPGAPALELVPPGEIPEFAYEASQRPALRAAIARSLSYLRKPSARGRFPVQSFTHERTVRTLEAFDGVLARDPSAAALRQEILARFDVYRSVGWNGKGDVQFTGYYTPVFEASRTPSATYRYPLYRRPPDLVLEDGVPHGRRRPDGTVEPYPSRREIEEGGVLAGKGLELAYLRDPFDAYIVHVQGSAILRLPDGSELRVGYHGKTDRPYHSVADALLTDGRISRKERSLQGLRAHFRAHPEDLPYLYRNESYVFFTESQGGPFGSLNETVTPYVTVALDAGVFPRAALAYVDTRIPRVAAGAPPARGGVPPCRPFQAFMMNQDTGGAIRSAGRADLYLGIGPEAEAIAGHAQEEGRLYFLLLRE